MLLEESYLEKMLSTMSESDYLFYDVILGYLNADTPDLRAKADADAYISANDNIEWLDKIGVLTDEYGNTDKMVDEVTSLLHKLNDIYYGAHEVTFYFYPKRLATANLQFLSDEYELDIAPVKEQMFAFWTIKWSKSALDKTNGDITPFIENRKVIKQRINKSNQ